MLVVIVGWFECSARQLLPFAAIHHDRGHRTHLLAGNGIDGLLRLDRFTRACAAKASDLISAAGEDDILVHVLSDAGFTTFCILLQHLRKSASGRRLIGRIRGVVLDSAPGLYAADRAEFSRRFAHIMTQFLIRRLRGAATWYQPLLMAVCLRILDLYQALFAKTVRRLQGAFAAVASDYPVCPHLFLYGNRDPITPAADIEAFASALGLRGVSTQGMRFDTAKHLGSYRYAADKYRDAIHDFVDRHYPAPHRTSWLSEPRTADGS